MLTAARLWTSEIKNNQYVYYHCSFDKGGCSRLIVIAILSREETSCPNCPAYS